MLLSRGTVVGDYRIEELLGQGGMGAVFRARNMKSGRLVALKLIAEGRAGDPVRDARFRGEGRAQALAEHPNIVTVYDAGESDHGLYLAMHLVDGPPLVDLIRDRTLDARRALGVLEQVGDALDAAHSVGLVHRDVKPENVLVASGDHAFLADFGLTRASAEPTLTGTGQIVGTVAYLAPELMRGGDATPAADRYAFAAIAFECLTGTVVFPRATGPSMLFAHASDPPPRIGGRRPELGDALDDIFYRALAKDPAARPRTCRALVEQIRRELERTGGMELPPPPPVGAAALAGPRSSTRSSGVSDVAPPPPSRRSRSQLAFVGITAALAGAAIVVLASSLDRDGDDGPVMQRVATDLPGLTYIGTDLDGPPARTVDCRGRTVMADSPSCTIVQSRLPGATTVVPRNGVIRNWQVRGARGELRLVATRPRDGGSFQVTRSRWEPVGSADVHSFDTDLPVERGDVVGLHVSPGSGVGTRSGIAGATTDRWLPPVAGLGRPPDHKAGSGFNREVLLRVGYAPGGKLSLPVATSGREAATLPAGRVRDRRNLRIDEHRYVMALVEVEGRVYLDQFEAGKRLARIAVVGMRDDARLVRFATAQWDTGLGGVDVHFLNVDSARVTERGFETGTNGLVAFG
jgi:serine/threonine-protein kinase